MKYRWKPILLTCLCVAAALPAMADSRGDGDRQRDRVAEYDRRGEVRERRREAAVDRSRDRRRHLSDEERARLRRDVLEAFRASRESR